MLDLGSDEVGSQNPVALFFDQHLESVDALPDPPCGVPIRCPLVYHANIAILLP